MEEDEILKYSMQIAMLKQLLRKELINEKEYEKIKKKLMEEYKIYERIEKRPLNKMSGYFSEKRGLKNIYMKNYVLSIPKSPRHSIYKV